MRNSHFFEKADRYDRSIIAKRNGIYPYFREIYSEQNTEIELRNNKDVIMMGSNSYLGLSSHPEVKMAAMDATLKYGTGCGGSPFLNGTLDIHTSLENSLASFVKKERSLLYSSGFMANLGAITTLMGRHDYLILDSANHASIMDAARLALSKTLKFRHNDMSDLKRVLSSTPREKCKMIVTDGIFSMDGDIANLPEIVNLAKEFNAVVMVDEAHSIGVLGKTGAGTAEYFNLTDEIDVIMGTFSKSLASTGGFIASDFRTIEFLKHHSRAMIFSASIPPSSVAATQKAMEIIVAEPERIEKLWHNTFKFKQLLHSAGIDTGLSETPIISIPIGKDETAFHLCKKLEGYKIFVNPVIFPAVPKDKAMIRLSLMSTHTSDQIKYVASVLSELLSGEKK